LKITFKIIISIFFTVLISNDAFAVGNNWNDSFYQSKGTLESQVYYDGGSTLYCAAEFDREKNITLPEGFVSTKYLDRKEELEWEHVVPVENFGRAFEEWREGSPLCMDKEGESFKGRRCAEKINKEFRYMQSDMHNLYPAIGAVNGVRSNYNFQMLPNVSPSFGSCEMKIYNRKVEPPTQSRGQIARVYKYMQNTYPRFQMSKQQEKLMNAWDLTYEVDQWECTRAKRIGEIQGNENFFVKKQCESKGIW